MSDSIANKQQAVFDKTQVYGLEEAVSLVKQTAKAKFDESLDLAVMLGIDSRKSDQQVKRALVLPKGLGKTVKIAVFADGPEAREAKDAGADVVGMEDLAKSMTDGQSSYDLVIATPSSMKVVGRLGPILGPKGLMPNPKLGTVTQKVAQAVKDGRAGRLQFKADKGGVVHCSVGRVGFDVVDLVENIRAIVEDLRKAKPATSKGVYIKKVVLSSTMGCGIQVKLSDI